eukprot:TRINITY_DN30175_c0_g1_i1.p1 TRINITY_DN30175_c0_g1~~TRINITY_DN30175_c0_g1_i1.p1  ORF type:complete len:124 (+),score=29.14 TRINITY_DN30175_c0_g1_i1:60-431(+)
MDRAKMKALAKKQLALNPSLRAVYEQYLGDSDNEDAQTTTVDSVRPNSSGMQTPAASTALGSEAREKMKAFALKQIALNPALQSVYAEYLVDLEGPAAARTWKVIVESSRVASSFEQAWRSPR